MTDAAPQPSVDQHAWRVGSWVAAAAVAGFLVSAVFAGVLHWGRAAFLVPHLLVTALLTARFSSVHRLEIIPVLRHRWRHGVVGAIIVGAFVVQNVLRQPGGERPEGLSLLLALLWFGLAYGSLDALLMNVLPVLAAWAAAPDPQRPDLRSQILALVGSLVVTAAYHFGFPEFRGPALLAPLLGNAILTLGYLFARNPITPLAGHAAMHVAAVLHGMETTVQLPPHYGQ